MFGAIENLISPTFLAQHYGVARLALIHVLYTGAATGHDDLVLHHVQGTKNEHKLLSAMQVQRLLVLVKPLQ